MFQASASTDPRIILPGMSTPGDRENLTTENAKESSRKVLPGLLTPAEDI